MLHAEFANLLSCVLVSEGLSPAIYNQTYCAGTNPGFVGLKTYTILGALCKKKNKHHEYKIGYESEYLFIMIKITTNYKFTKLDKYHEHHKIQKNKIIRF